MNEYDSNRIFDVVEDTKKQKIKKMQTAIL